MGSVGNGRDVAERLYPGTQYMKIIGNNCEIAIYRPGTIVRDIPVTAPCACYHAPKDNGIQNNLIKPKKKAPL